MPWCQHGTGKVGGDGWSWSQGHPCRRGTRVLLGRKGGPGFIGTPGLTSPRPPLLSSGSYLDSEGLRHQDDFDVSLLVCHCAAPFEEQGEAERHVLRSADPLPQMQLLPGGPPSLPCLSYQLSHSCPLPILGCSSSWCSPANESYSPDSLRTCAGSGSRPD